MLWIAASGLALNLAANAVLVPMMGIEGAGIATLLTELLVALLAARALERAGARSSWRAWGWIGGPLLFAAGYATASALARGAVT